MPQHGDYDRGLKKWYCSYWMSLRQWEDIHDYSPRNATDLRKKEGFKYRHIHNNRNKTER